MIILVFLIIDVACFSFVIILNEFVRRGPVKSINFFNTETYLSIDGMAVRSESYHTLQTLNSFSFHFYPKCKPELCKLNLAYMFCRCPTISCSESTQNGQQPPLHYLPIFLHQRTSSTASNYFLYVNTIKYTTGRSERAPNMEKTGSFHLYR